MSDDSEHEAEFDGHEVEPSVPKKSKPVIKKKNSSAAASNASARPKVPQKAARKDAIVESDDGDADEEDDRPPKRKKSNATPQLTGKKRVHEDIDDEVDDEDDGDGDEDEDDDDNDDEEEEEELPRKKHASAAKPKAKPKSKTSSSSKIESKQTSKSKTVKREIKAKDMTKLGRLEEAVRAFKWWEAEELPEGIQWRSLEHNGVLFTAPYVPHGVKMLYDGNPVTLSPSEEEVASFYALIPEDGPQLGNAETREIFQSNFFKDFRSVLRHGTVIKKFSKCDFGPIRSHLMQQREIKKAATDEEKARAKAEKERLQVSYGFALIDGRIEKLGNFNMEPPSLFRGRGKHPLTGTLKRRVQPEQVTLNIASDCPVPKCAVPGHAWSAVQHDPHVTWMSSWRENVLGSNKYVMLAASSSFKGKSDMQKYAKAIRLKSCIQRIRADYTKKLKSLLLEEKQMGTAMWVIDQLALRVGGEKGEDEADTVGCCSLRLEHLKFTPGDDIYEIELEFLGKDSMLYKQLIDFARYGDIGKRVYDNFKSFSIGKRQTDDIFDRLTPSLLNAHLTSLMPGLTAKVFRTYNASETLQNELPTPEAIAHLSVPDKVVAYNRANKEVAILCNHQRTVTKGLQQTLDNMNDKLELLKSQRRALQEMKKLITSNRGSKVELLLDDGEAQERLKKSKERAEKLKQEAKTSEQKLKATAALEEAKALKAQLAKDKAEKAHLFAAIPSVAQVEKRIDTWTDKIRKTEVDLRNRDENKEVALGTSKINYMDPRITVAWCKRCEVPIERIFAKTLREKFIWALGVPPDWRFE